MAQRKATTTAKERLATQITETRAILGKAVSKGDLTNAIRAQTLLVRLTGELDRINAVEAANRKRNPIAKTVALRKLAEADGSWVAAARMAAQEREQIQEMSAKLATAVDAATLTPEQWRQRVLDDVKACTIEDLELYVVEWLDRHKMDMVIEQGTPIIRRRTA